MRRSTRFSCWLAALALPWASGAAVITVDTTADEIGPLNGQCSLREAIQAANTDAAVDSCTAGSGADTIEVPAGTYTITIGGTGEDANQTGDFDVTEDVEIVGSGSLTVLDGADEDRVLHVQCDASAPAEVTVTVRDLRVTDGLLIGGGGGIYLEDCAFDVNATLLRLELDGNASGAAGIPLASARPGGAIGVDTGGIVTIRDSFIHDNIFYQDVDDYGSLGGGAIGVTGGGSTLIEDCHLQGNQTVAAPGGELPSGGGLWTESITEVRGTTFHDNRIQTSGRGGAIYCRNTLLHVENSTLIANRAVRGGAFANGVDGEPGCITTFDSVTVVSNDASAGGGIVNDTGGFSLTNSIVAGNIQGISEDPSDVVGTFTSGDYNLIGNADGTAAFTEPNDLTGTLASPLDPQLGAYAAEGFAAPTIPPLPTSPAWNSGGATPLLVDQRGLPRGPFGFAIERGAAEVLDANFGVYLDVASYGGSPSSAYAAAATAPGTWNSFGLGTFPALASNGSQTAVTIQIATESSGGIGAGATDAARLFVDDARDCSAPEDWSVDFAGLPNADYLVFVYAPFNPGRDTGNVVVDAGPTIPSLDGGTFALDEGVSWVANPTTVSIGTIAVSGSDATLDPDCAAVAGVQVLPEPGRDVAWWLGAALLAGARLARAVRTDTPAR